MYAIPDDNEGTGTIWVNATYFGVQCGEAGDAFQVHNGSDHMGYDKTVPQFSIADFNGDGEGFPGWVFGDSDFKYPVFGAPLTCPGKRGSHAYYAKQRSTV